MRYHQEQLADWAAGRPQHVEMYPDDEGFEQHCPDFSCCRPELLQTPEIRAAFLQSGTGQRACFVVAFVAALGLHARFVAEYVARTRRAAN